MTVASLHLVVPGLTARMPGVEQLSPPLSLPALQRFLSRADLEHVAGSDLESTLCPLFGVAPAESGDYPVAALRRGEHDQRFWLQAEPVCLRPDQQRLLLFDTKEFEVSGAELKSLAAIFIRHFEEEEWMIETDDPFCWYISLPKPAAIGSHNLGEVFGRNVDLFLPEGGDRLRWHALLNEVQMLFFDSEVNRRREAEGKMPIGGLWFSGFGRLPERLSSDFGYLYGDDPLTAGLARLSATPLGVPADFQGDSPSASGSVLVVYSKLQRPVWRADTFDWAEQLAGFNLWLEQRLEDLRLGWLNELLLYPCDGRLFRLGRRHRHRFWRSSKPLSHWLQEQN